MLRKYGVWLLAAVCLSSSIACNCTGGSSRECYAANAGRGAPWKSSMGGNCPCTTACNAAVCSQGACSGSCGSAASNCAAAPAGPHPAILPPGADATAKPVIVTPPAPMPAGPEKKPAEPAKPGEKKTAEIDQKPSDPPAKIPTDKIGEETIESPKLEGKAPATSDQPVTVGPTTELQDTEKPSKESTEQKESAPAAFSEAGETPLYVGHADDYSWVSGKIEFLNSRNQWRVRYAGYDSDDRYGGVIALSGVDHLSGQLKEGMTVRIQGQLVKKDTPKSYPEFFVYEIKLIK